MENLLQSKKNLISSYHHGENNLQSTIINMAQNFVGSNNINLLVPSGMFGTRHQGGKDAASARYIFTNLNRLTRLIFPEVDDELLEYLDDDGLKIEPKWSQKKKIYLLEFLFYKIFIFYKIFYKIYLLKILFLKHFRFLFHKKKNYLREDIF